MNHMTKPLARLAAAGLAGAGILGNTVAATLNTRARPAAPWPLLPACLWLPVPFRSRMSG
jgi:hypothetical protein